MPFVSVLGWTILALSLESDHPDFLGWLGVEPFWLKFAFTILLLRARVGFSPYLQHISDATCQNQALLAI